MTRIDKHRETHAEAEAAAAHAPRLPPMLRALRHRNYRLFLAGQVVSLSGTWMQSVAQSWLVYRLTGSAMLLGVVSFCSLIPVLLFSTIGGAVADRYDRRRVLMLTQIASMLLAFTLAALTLTGFVRVWHLPLLAACLGVVNAIDVPTRQAFVVNMVGKPDLINAIALNSSTFNATRIIGPSLAGVLVATVGEGWCFFINGATYLAVIASLAMMRGISALPLRPLENTLSSATAGFRFVWRTPTVRALVALLVVVSLVGQPYIVLMPIFAAKVLHGGPRALGLLMGAAGLGALAGALRLAARRGVHGLERRIAFAVAGFGVCLALFALSRSFWLSAALLVPAGFCMISQMAASNTLVQTLVPDELRGRVMAVYSMMFLGVAPIGALLAGAAAGRWGAPQTVLVGALACIAAAATLGVRLAALEHDADRLIVATSMVAGDPAEEETGRGSALVSDGKTG